MRTVTIAIVATYALVCGASSGFAQRQGNRMRDQRGPLEQQVFVRSIAPDMGRAGTRLTIRGAGFDHVIAVQIGPHELVPMPNGLQMLTVEVPPMAPGAHAVVLITDRGTIAAGEFIIQPSANYTNRQRDRQYNRWRERPIVSHFAPRIGVPGERVVIRGENLPMDAVVQMGTTMGTIQVVPRRRTSTRIVFQVPPRAQDGAITLVSPGLRRPIFVGHFEVRRYNWSAERARTERERRRAAEDAWKRRRAGLAADPADRRASLLEQERALRGDRETRRRERVSELRSRWSPDFLADADTRSELALHSERMARLQRMLRLAEVRDNGKVVVRVEVAMERERQRHERRMATLFESFRVQGG